MGALWPVLKCDGQAGLGRGPALALGVEVLHTPLSHNSGPSLYPPRLPSRTHCSHITELGLIPHNTQARSGSQRNHREARWPGNLAADVDNSDSPPYGSFGHLARLLLPLPVPLPLKLWESYSTSESRFLI